MRRALTVLTAALAVWAIALFGFDSHAAAGCRYVVESTENHMEAGLQCLFRDTPPPAVYVRDPTTDRWSRAED